MFIRKCLTYFSPESKVLQMRRRVHYVPRYLSFHDIKNILFFFNRERDLFLIVPLLWRVYTPAGLPVVCVSLHRGSLMLTYRLWGHFPSERKLIRLFLSRPLVIDCVCVCLSMCVYMHECRAYSSEVHHRQDWKNWH